jgi:hypothetical protein
LVTAITSSKTSHWAIVPGFIVENHQLGTKKAADYADPRRFWLFLIVNR